MDITDNKTRYDLLPWDALEIVARLLTLGADSHGERGWETLPDGAAKYRQAIGRHVSLMYQGEYLDKDDSLPVEAHIAADALIALSLRLSSIKPLG